MKNQKELVNENKNCTVAQKEIKPASGILMLIVITMALLASIALCIGGGVMISEGNTIAGVVMLIIGVICCIVFPVLYGGLKVVGPNEALVLTLFGN